MQRPGRLIWYPAWQEPRSNSRILAYSPIYEGNKNQPDMAYRFMSSESLRFCSEVTEWCYIESEE